MGDRIVELRDILSGTYEESRVLLSRLSETDLPKATENGWSVGQMAGHIARSPAGSTYVVRRLRQGKSATVPGVLSFLINVRNFLGTRKFKRATKRDLLGELERSHNELFAMVTELSDEELDRQGTVFGIGRLSTYEFLKRSPVHPHEHGEELMRAIGA
jgi:hypothetical protein